MQYRVTDRTGATAIITADRYEQDGSGARFYAGNDPEEMIASFYDGQISSVVPASIQFTAGDES